MRGRPCPWLHRDARRSRGVGQRVIGPLLALTAAACGATGPQAPPDPCEAAQALRPTPDFLSVAEEADIAARVLPGGFGGMYERFPGNGTSGTLVVYLKDLSKQDEVATLLPRLLQCGGAYPGWLGGLVSTVDLAFKQGRYTGSEILSFFRAVQPLDADPDVWGIANDPEVNRVWIGLGTEAAGARLQQALGTVSVPLDAVTLEAPPPATGAEPFMVLDAPVSVGTDPGVGVFSFSLRVQYTNRQTGSRYPGWCVVSEPTFAYTIEQWDGTKWVQVYDPICLGVAMAPREVAPDASVTDTIPITAVRLLDAAPVWGTGRIMGTYRLVGKVYTTTTSSPPYLGDLAPADEQVSVPFRLVGSLPF